MYDMIVIGAGPAGVASAIYGTSRGKKVLVLEKNAIGGLIGKVSTVTHYPGIIERESGQTFAARLKSQLEQTGAEIRFEEVIDTDLSGNPKKIMTDQKTYEAKTIVLANGGSPKMLGIPGEQLEGVRLNAVKDGPDYAGKNVYVIGGADGAVKEALYLSKIADQVTIVCIEPQLACIDEFRKKVIDTDNIHVKPHSSLTCVRGDQRANTFEFTDNETGAKTFVDDPQAGVFVYAGIVPNSSLFKGIELDEMGFIRTDENMETNISGVYAAGDIRAKKVRQVATAVNDGAISAINASVK